MCETSLETQNERKSFKLESAEQSTQKVKDSAFSKTYCSLKKVLGQFGNGIMHLFTKTYQIPKNKKTKKS